MELTLLLKSVAGLIVILGILVFLLLLSYRNKKAKHKVKLATKTKSQEKEILKEKSLTDIPTLLAIIKNKKSTAKELSDALNLMLKHHGTIAPKLGARSHPDFDIYMGILFAICRHPNTNKDIILNFNRELDKKNPAYKKDINDAVAKGLNSRGV